MSDNPSLVIVGAGAAGVGLAFSAARQGWDGTIVLVSEEAELPYQRPPLSKAHLLEKSSADALAFRLIVVGGGMLPDERLAFDTGRTVDRDILAAGDCTVPDNPLHGRCILLESISNALEQAHETPAAPQPVLP